MPIENTQALFTDLSAEASDQVNGGSHYSPCRSARPHFTRHYVYRPYYPVYFSHRPSSGITQVTNVHINIDD